MLEVDNLSVRYGALDAVRGVSLRLAPGEVVALIGGNGAGKSSVLRAVAGAVRPAAGSVRLFGENITGLAPHQIVRRGAVLVPEGRMIFTQLSVQRTCCWGRTAPAAAARHGRDWTRCSRASRPWRRVSARRPQV